MTQGHRGDRRGCYLPASAVRASTNRLRRKLAMGVDIVARDGRCAGHLWPISG